MALTATRLIDIATSQIGYLEKASNKALDSFKDNAGYANWTKYGAWYGLNPAAWCAMFVSWCFAELAGGKPGAKKMLCGSLWASCTQMYNAFKAQGRVFSVPKPGDIVVFRKSAGSSTMAHTGIVTRIANNTIYTVEGNTSSAAGVVANGGAVAAKSYSLSNVRIGGFLRPFYDEPAAKNAKKEPVTLNTFLYKKGDKGDGVKAIQILLNGWGFDCGKADGDFGANTDAAVRAFQKKRKLTIDGECGAQTQTALLGG